jgi:hypothetical protein
MIARHHPLASTARIGTDRRATASSARIGRGGTIAQRCGAAYVAAASAGDGQGRQAGFSGGVRTR